ncbi:unnamed protein product [Sympodiomycopsis kandeliae]
MRPIPSSSAQGLESPNHSQSSSGHLPTTISARSRVNSSNTQHNVAKRFEDFDNEDDDDSFIGSQNVKAKSSEQASTRGQSRRPRKTLNEEADDSGFIFTRTAPAATSSNAQLSKPSPSNAVTPAGPPSDSPANTVQDPSSSNSVPRTPRTVIESLPSDQLGETPINHKNRLYRSGLATPSGKPRRPSAADMNRRRSSLSFREARRTSSMREASNSYPHPGIPDRELHRHISDDTSPVTRMKTLADWALDRSRLETIATLPSASASAPVAPRGKRARKNDEQEAEEQGESKWSVQEKKLLERCRATLEQVMLDTMRDLQDGKMSISWLNQSGAQAVESEPVRKSNPENQTNSVLANTLSLQADALRAENAKWEEETRETEAYEAETANLLKLVSSMDVSKSLANSSGGDVTAPPTQGADGGVSDLLAWEKNDMDADMKEMMDLARKALASEEHWVPANGSSASTQERDLLEMAIQSASTREHPKGRRKSRSASNDKEHLQSRLQGTDLDERWQDFAYNADLLHSQTHLLDQMTSLSSQYTGSISSRAAHALRQLAFGPGEASSSSTTSGAEADTLQMDRQGQEKLLSGIRESTAPRRLPLDQELAQVRQGIESTTHVLKIEAASGQEGSTRQIDEMDQSAADLFRAFSRAGSSSKPAARQAGSSTGPTTGKARVKKR